MIELLLALAQETVETGRSTEPWECLSTDAKVPDLPRLKEYPDGGGDYNPDGLRLFGKPVLWLRHGVSELPEVGWRHFYYGAVVRADINVVVRLAELANQDMRCHPLGKNFLCDPQSGPAFYGARSMFIGLGHATATMEEFGDNIVITCTWREKL